MKKLLALITTLIFFANTLIPPSVSAQTLSGGAALPQPGTMAGLSQAFTPAHFVGVTIDPVNALNFDFIIHKGDLSLTEGQKREEYRTLVKYFLAALAVPDEAQWVNLSPYEGSRIIEDHFGMTEMGRDLLNQDYLLKQLTASLLHPDSETGKKFWAKVYEKAWQKYGTTEIPVDTFNKIWIMPDKAVVFEKGRSAFIVQSHLKVMTERDYLSMQNNAVVRESGSPVKPDETTQLSSEVVKEVILPEIEREVNEGKNFANLRQIVSAMILATWYKKALKGSLLGKIYADKGKVKGIDQDPRNNQAIYEQYLEAFKKGAFNLIREDYDRYSAELIPRKYFSGGFMHGDIQVTHDLAQASAVQAGAAKGEFDAASVTVDPAKMTRRTFGAIMAAPAVAAAMPVVQQLAAEDLQATQPPRQERPSIVQREITRLDDISEGSLKMTGIYYVGRYDPHLPTLLFVHGVARKAEFIREFLRAYEGQYNLSLFAYDDRQALDNADLFRSALKGWAARVGSRGGVIAAHSFGTNVGVKAIEDMNEDDDAPTLAVLKQSHFIQFAPTLFGSKEAEPMEHFVGRLVGKIAGITKIGLAQLPGGEAVKEIGRKYPTFLARMGNNVVTLVTEEDAHLGTGKDFEGQYAGIARNAGNAPIIVPDLAKDEHFKINAEDIEQAHTAVVFSKDAYRSVTEALSSQSIDRAMRTGEAAGFFRRNILKLAFVTIGASAIGGMPSGGMALASTPAADVTFVSSSEAARTVLADRTAIEIYLKTGAQSKNNTLRNVPLRQYAIALANVLQEHKILGDKDFVNWLDRLKGHVQVVFSNSEHATGYKSHPLAPIKTASIDISANDMDGLIAPATDPAGRFAVHRFISLLGHELTHVISTGNRAMDELIATLGGFAMLQDLGLQDAIRGEKLSHLYRLVGERFAKEPLAGKTFTELKQEGNFGLGDKYDDQYQLALYGSGILMVHLEDPGQNRYVNWSRMFDIALKSLEEIKASNDKDKDKNKDPWKFLDLLESRYKAEMAQAPDRAMRTGEGTSTRRSFLRFGLRTLVVGAAGSVLLQAQQRPKIPEFVDPFKELEKYSDMTADKLLEAIEQMNVAAKGNYLTLDVQLEYETARAALRRLINKASADEKKEIFNTIAGKIEKEGSRANADLMFYLLKYLFLNEPRLLLPLLNKYIMDETGRQILEEVLTSGILNGNLSALDRLQDLSKKYYDDHKASQEWQAPLMNVHYSASMHWMVHRLAAFFLLNGELTLFGKDFISKTLADVFINSAVVDIKSIDQNANSGGRINLGFIGTAPDLLSLYRISYHEFGHNYLSAMAPELNKKTVFDPKNDVEKMRTVSVNAMSEFVADLVSVRKVLKSHRSEVAEDSVYLSFLSALDKSTGSGIMDNYYRQQAETIPALKKKVEELSQKIKEIESQERTAENKLVLDAYKVVKDAYERQIARSEQRGKPIEVILKGYLDKEKELEAHALARGLLAWFVSKDFMKTATDWEWLWRVAMDDINNMERMAAAGRIQDEDFNWFSFRDRVMQRFGDANERTKAGFDKAMLTGEEILGKGVILLLGDEWEAVKRHDATMNGDMKGGIDLNQANLGLQIRRDGNGVPLPVSQQDLENIHIDGLIPTILDIRPVTTLPMLSDALVEEPVAVGS